MIPIILRLKKANHKKIAKAQDAIIEEMYKIFKNAVVHGGTAIWRCYNGSRFSEDVDVYIHKDLGKINEFFGSLEKRGFAIEKKKISQNSIYSALKFDGTIVRFEAIFKNIAGSLKEYEDSEGNYITIYTLTPEELVKEKINAYQKRLKIRDIYDIFFLLRYVKNKEEIKKELRELLLKFKEPIDEKELKVLILEGIVPDLEKMLQYIKSYV